MMEFLEKPKGKKQSQLLPHIFKIKLGWLIDLNVEAKTKKILEETE